MATNGATTRSYRARPRWDRWGARCDGAHRPTKAGTAGLAPEQEELPAWVGPETLVIASSKSGDTEETLRQLESANSYRLAQKEAAIAAAEATFLDPHVSVGQVSAYETIGLAKRPEPSSMT